MIITHLNKLEVKMGGKNIRSQYRTKKNFHGQLKSIFKPQTQYIDLNTVKKKLMKTPYTAKKQIALLGWRLKCLKHMSQKYTQ